MGIELFILMWICISIFLDFFISALADQEPVTFTVIRNISEFIYSFYQFAIRGFDDNVRVEFVVNEQITLGGDCKYYITKETFIGKSKKPEKVQYLIQGTKRNPSIDDFLESSEKFKCFEGDNYSYRGIDLSIYNQTFNITTQTIYFDTFEDAMNECQKHRQEHDRKLERYLLEEEQKKLSTVHTTNKYKI